MKLYKGRLQPARCAMPLIIQMGVFIALYRALRFRRRGSPESLVGPLASTSTHPMLQNAIPLSSTSCG